MKIRTYYTDNEIKKILSHIEILCDTREQKSQHIIAYFEQKKIPWRKHTMEFGDYSFCLKANELMETGRDTYFDRSIVIERKAHLEELSGNLAQERSRFESEWLRAKDTKKILLIEKGSLSDIWDNKYNTDYKPNSYMASLLTFQERYNIQTIFIKEKYTAQLIYGLCYYHLRELLNG